MTEKPTVESAEPQSPPHGPEGNPPPAVTPTRSRRKKILVPVVLAGIGLGLLLAGFLAYPRRAEPPAPFSGFVEISGYGGASNYVSSHISPIYYTVDQVHPDVAKLTIKLFLYPPVPVPHDAQAGITVYVRPPIESAGARTIGSIIDCSPRCRINSPLDSASAASYFGSDGRATAYFLVKVHSFGVAVNGVTAEAAFPQFLIAGGQPADVILTYPIPSANSYDWSSFPAVALTSFHAVWAELVTPGNPQQPLESGVTLARVATGINHAAESNDNTLTLFAGVLFGLGGGALVAAVQEALHD